MNDLNKIAPKLSKIEKDNPLRAPENYFQDFPKRLQVIISSNSTQLKIPEQRNKFVRIITPALKIAASIAIIALLLYQPLKKKFSGYVAKSISQTISTPVSEEERLLLMIKGIDENSFLTLLDESDLKEISNSDINDEDLISYLCSNISDYEIFLQNIY